MSQDLLLVLCTCPNDDAAAEIATAVVEQKLAACVNRIPAVKSWYRWEGRLQQDDEVLLLIKTTPGRFDALQNEIGKLHPYEVPELIGVRIGEASEAYLKWVVESTT